MKEFWPILSRRPAGRGFGRPTGRLYLPELDGLRSVSILTVVIWHASLRATRYYGTTGSPQQDSLYSAFPHGEIGVLIFFVISGFVVSLPFLKSRETIPTTRTFFARRIVRIYPPYILTLAISFFILGIVGHIPQSANSYQESSIPLWKSLLASLFYLHGLIYNAPSRLNPPMWSLELEVAFYILTPLLMLAYSRIRSRNQRCALLVLAIVVNVICLSLDGNASGEGSRFRSGLFHYVYYFLTGILLTECSDFIVGHRAKSYWFDACFAASLLMLLYCGLRLTELDAVIPGGWRWCFFRFFLLGLIVSIILCAFRGKLSASLLSLNSVRAIGISCYSIYLTHVPVIQACSEILSRYLPVKEAWHVWVLWLTVSIAASMLCGFLFYIVVERPFALAAGRIGRPRSYRSVAEAARSGGTLPSRAASQPS